jgi:hypothetical protein
VIGVTEALIALRPNAEWNLPEGTYESLVWLDNNQTKPTKAEVDAKITELQSAEPMRLLRQQRNWLLAETDWWASSDLTMTAEQTAYRQALRDITNTYQSLDTVVWPTKPE